MTKTLANFLVAPLCTLLIACGGDNPGGDSPKPRFEYTGLTGHIVSQITAYADDEVLFAATNKGIYVAADGGWQLRSPNTWQVNSIEFLNPSHILASVTVDGEHKLMESLTTGEDWDEVASDFGIDGSGANQEQIRKLMFDGDSDILYGVGLGVLAQSQDIGREWTLIDGGWQSFASGLSALQRHPQTQDLWIGGQGAIENPVLRQVVGEGEETIDHSAATAELLEVPSVVKAIKFFVDDAERILVSGEGGIIQSRDYGQTWEALHVNHNARFYFDVVIDPEDSDTLYTAGWDKNFDDPQELRLEVSEDGGATWKVHKYHDPQLRGGVWSMHLRREGSQNALYLGLCNGGVFRVTIK